MKRCILSVFALLLYSASWAQTFSPAPQVDSLMVAYERVFDFSGSLLVVQEDEVVLEKSYGLANRSFGVPNTPQTRFSINSISKTFTATAILLLVEAGKLDLQSPVGVWLPSLRADWKDSVTIHHLLSHAPGLPREAGIQASSEPSFAEQVKVIQDMELLFSPGEQYGYSNAGYALLGAILERASGTSYARFIDSAIIQPVQLHHTGVYRGRKVVPLQAVPYRLGPLGLEAAPRSKHEGDNAGGGLYSTVADLYAWVCALEEHRLLPDSLTRLLFFPHQQSGEGEAEGYAWSIKHFGEDSLHFAAGSGYGTKSVILRSPESRSFIGITSNWGNTPILSLLRDIYLLTKGQAVSFPSADLLANPKEFREALGTYRFEPGVLHMHLGETENEIVLQTFGDKLFLNDELLARKGEDALGLTYTDELTIRIENGRMIISINGNVMEGRWVR